MRLRYDASYTPPVFAWDGDFHSRHIPKAAGFSYHGSGKVWVTTSARKARALAQYADAATLAEIEQVAAEQQAAALATE